MSCFINARLIACFHITGVNNNTVVIYVRSFISKISNMIRIQASSIQTKCCKINKKISAVVVFRKRVQAEQTKSNAQGHREPNMGPGPTQI